LNRLIVLVVKEKISAIKQLIFARNIYIACLIEGLI
jgi:hypothetical protein